MKNGVIVETMMISQRERKPAFSIRTGFFGIHSRVNRVTKRATVLVEHPDGQKHSDGLRYKTYYVPIARLLTE